MTNKELQNLDRDLRELIEKDTEDPVFLEEEVKNNLLSHYINTRFVEIMKPYLDFQVKVIKEIMAMFDYKQLKEHETYKTWKNKLKELL